MYPRTTVYSVKPGNDATVYRVTTQSSVYLLGVVMHRGRRFAVLFGDEDGPHAELSMRDSDPLIGERSLWDVSSAEWVGHRLSVATMTTSAIRSVVRDSSSAAASTLTALTAPASATRAVAAAVVTGQRAPGAAPAAAPVHTSYPGSYVEYAEQASTLLRALLRRQSLFDDVAADGLLARRLEVALADCVVSLERLARHRVPR